ncbi:MAG: AsmA-like C-terminal region-containing protein, partial [Polyangia bacterium]|nr:AsmA-like C-terminal region-containing protein [Polyangia bacterium]
MSDTDLQPEPRQDPTQPEPEPGPGKEKLALDRPPDAKPGRARGKHPRTLLQRAIRGVALGLLTLVILAAGTFYYLWTFYNGPALGERLARSFNKNSRGRVTIGSVRWSPRAAIDIVTGRDHKLIVEDLRFYDSLGRVVMHFPRIEGFGKLWPAVRSGHMLVRQAEAKEAFLRIDYYQRPDGPSRGSGNPYEVGLISAFESREKKTRAKDEPTNYFFESIHVRRASITFHHQLFELYFHRIEARGSLHVASATDSRPATIRFSVKPQGGEGSLRVAGYTLPLRQIEAPYVRTDPDVPTNLSFAVAGDAGGARFRLTSLIEGFHSVEEPRINLEALATGFAGPLSDLTRVAMEGGSETLTLNVRGPLRSPLLEARVEGIAARLEAGGRTLLAEDIRGSAHLQERRLTLEHLTCQTMEGALHLKGAADLQEKSFGGQLKLKHVRITPLLTSEEQRSLLGGLLDGQVVFRGSLAPRGLEVTEVDLGLRRQGRDIALPERLHLGGSGSFDGRRVRMKDLELKGAGLRIAGRGDVDVKNERLRLALQVEVARLRQVLHSAKMPDLARGIALKGRLSGTIRNPILQGQLSLRGAGTGRLRSRQLVSEVTVHGGALSFKRLQGDLAGGMLGGQGQLGLFDRRWRPQRAPYLEGRFLLVGASLAQLAPGHQARGSVTAHLALKGLPGAMSGSGGMVIRNASVAGHKIEHGSASVRLDRHKVTLQPLSLHWKGGGRLEAHGTYNLKGGKLDMEGHLWELPLRVLFSASPALREGLRGNLSGRFNLRGSESRPLVEAMMRVASVRLHGNRLGEGTATLIPQDGAMRLRGSFFDRFQVDGLLHLSPRPRATLRLTFQDLAVHELIPEQRWLPGRAEIYASGRVEVTLDAEQGITRMEAVLTRLDARLEQKDFMPGEAPGHLALKNDGTLRLLFDGRRLHLLQVRLQGSTGTLALSGWIAQGDSNMKAEASINLEPCRWLASKYLDGLTGRIWLKGRITGPLDTPRYQSEAWLAGLVLLPADRRVPVRIPTAHVSLSDRVLRIHKARVAVDTEESNLSGVIHHQKLHPQTLDLSLEGKLSAQILRLAIPHTFNHVSGRARASLRIQGDPDHPALSGALALDPIAFTLRGSGREFAILGGNLDIRNRRIRVKELRGSVDDGTYVVDGSIAMGRSWPWDMDIVVRGQGIPLKKPRAYELEL